MVNSNYVTLTERDVTKKLFCFILLFLIYYYLLNLFHYYYFILFFHMNLAQATQVDQINSHM